jgi:DNA-directed RNA polymerase subunit alpha
MKKQHQKHWRDLIRPKRIEVDPETFSDFYGRFVCEPLERGFGITLGNSLRRILLSSLHGAAIVSVQFDGVPHEFTSIPGVREDVTDLILNLKSVNLKLLAEEEEAVTIHLDVKGEKIITAADIITDDKVEIMNPNQHIATLDKDGVLRAEMVVKTGKGYVPAERHKIEDQQIGVIPIDALFSPIRKVTYVVGNARVGQRTDYDKLTFEVWTDGTVNPQDALAYAAKILKEQVAPFISFEEEPVEEQGVESNEEEARVNENLFRPVSELELSVRSSNCLKNADITYIYELVQKTESEMLKTKNFGRKSLNEIKGILEEMGLHFGTKLEDFPLPEEGEGEAEASKEEDTDR